MTKSPTLEPVNDRTKLESARTKLPPNAHVFSPVTYCVVKLPEGRRISWEVVASGWTYLPATFEMSRSPPGGRRSSEFPCVSTPVDWMHESARLATRSVAIVRARASMDSSDTLENEKS